MAHYPIEKFQAFPLKRNHLVMKLHVTMKFVDSVLSQLPCLMVIVLVCLQNFSNLYLGILLSPVNDLNHDLVQVKTCCFVCSGIALPRGTARLDLTRFVTSAYLVRVFNERRNRDDKLRVSAADHSILHFGMFIEANCSLLIYCFYH